MTTELREPFGVRSDLALRELRDAANFAVELPDPEPDATLPGTPSDALETLTAKVGAETSAQLLKNYFPARQVHANWQTTGKPRAHGEFCLSNIVACLTEQQPSLGDPALPPQERSVLAELRIVDENPYSGTGNATGIHIPGPHLEPQIWFYDMARSRLSRLELDYPSYLETALLTKGAGGWQYLFTDVDLSDPPLRRVAENLETALELLPEAFPNHDYSDLRTRLEARQ